MVGDFFSSGGCTARTVEKFVASLATKYLLPCFYQCTDDHNSDSHSGAERIIQENGVSIMEC